ncbi:MAG: hypothetical protein VB070_06040 [Clostridiaceae bacterium]|nr:hypothetical protein [Clostridiaceae bacterium]
MQNLIVPYENWALAFKIPASEGDIYKAVQNDMITTEASFLSGVVTCRFVFDFSKIPLTLTAKADYGDLIEIFYLTYRIELYVNKRLCDEEWPCGNICFNHAELTQNKSDLSISEYVKEKKIIPSVTGSFIDAEGWKPEDNVFVGDCMPFSHDGIYHVFYLKDRHHHTSKWGKGAHQWAHISTEDMVHWNTHPMAVEIDQQSEGSICTGSVIYHNGRFYAFYSIRPMDGSSAPLCCSLSQDGYHFVKSQMIFHISDKYNQNSVRDPKVFRGQEGLFHMLVTTSIKHGDEWQGCLAHLTSRDLDHWHEEPEPAFLTEFYAKDFKTPWSIEPECSDYFMKNNWYYLVSRSQYWLSDKPFGDWIQPEHTRIPCGNVPKMAFFQDSRMIFTGFTSNNEYAGSLTFKEAVQNDDGTLQFVPVKK